MTAKEVWFRNPDNYIRELVEVGSANVAFDRGVLVKKSIDPIKFCDLYFPAAVDWRLMAVGEQGTALYSRGTSWYEPDAVFPTWDYDTEPLSALEEMMQENIGNDKTACTDDAIPADERPVYGQAHRVVIINSPAVSAGPGRKFLNDLKALAIDYPDCGIHLHGSYSYRAMFAFPWASVDVDPRALAAKGQVILPTGKKLLHEQTATIPHWITLLGMSPVDLEIARNRCMYNIKSAMWAGLHYDENYAFSTKRVPTMEGRDPGEGVHPVLAGSGSMVPFVRHDLPVVSAKDKIACDTCSLSDACRYYREGAVCSIPGVETKDLSDQFQTRDAGTIIDGLGAVMGKAVRRTERALEKEEFEDEIDPEVTKMINSLMKNGVALAKLVDPRLGATGPKVGVVVTGGGSAHVSTGGETAQATAARVYAELQAMGYDHSEITPDLVTKYLSGELGKPALGSAVVVGADGEVVR